MLRTMLLLFVLSACAGCATVVSRTTEFGARPYPATTMDAGAIWMAVSPSSIVGDSHDDAEGLFRCVVLVGGIVDLPISVVTDTLCLPYDITQYRKRVALRKASLHSLAEILAACVPPEAEVLSQPQADDGPCILLPNPTVMLPGVSLDWTIEGRKGAEKRYRHPGRPGFCIKTFNLETEDREMDLLVIRIREDHDNEVHNKPFQDSAVPPHPER